MTKPIRRGEPFSTELLFKIRTTVKVGDVISTLATGAPNKLWGISSQGILVEARSCALVPAWMIERGWRHLITVGEMTNTELLNEVDVKRSSFVCALLAEFPEVQVTSLEPITLVLGPPG